jgi:MATE family multidrug resistance protein
MYKSTTLELARLAWPVLVAQLAMMANAVIDTAMAGRLSPVDLASVGIASSITATILMSLVSVLLALPPIIAHLHGAGKAQEIGREIHQSVWISLALAAVSVLLLHYPGPLIWMSHLTPAVETKVRAYLDASAWGAPAVIAGRIFFGLLTGIGRPKAVMAFNLLSLMLKVPLNAVFMYGLLSVPAMGGPGAAAATAVDAYLMAFLAWGWCLRHPDFESFRIRARFAAPNPAAIREFLKLGIPIGLTFVADVTAFTLMALFIARLGPITSGAHQIAANISATAFMIPLSIGNAASVLVGQALGRNDPARAREICWKAVGLGLFIACAVSATYWTCASQIAGLYTSNPEVRAIAAPLIMLAGLYHLADSLQAVTVNALRGYKKSVIPMIIYAGCLWILGLGGGVLLGLTDTFGAALGAKGFWIAAIGSLSLVALSVAFYLNYESHQHAAGH